MKNGVIEPIDESNTALRKALAIADLLTCIGNSSTLENTIQETGFVLICLIREALEATGNIDLNPATAD